jgi:hypothetical protein
LPSRGKIVAAVILGLVLIAAVGGIAVEYSAANQAKNVNVTWNSIETTTTPVNASWLVEVQNTGLTPVVNVSLVRVDVLNGGQVTRSFSGLMSSSNSPPNPFVLEDSTVPCCSVGNVVNSPTVWPNATGHAISPTAPMAPGRLAYSEKEPDTQSDVQFFQTCAAQTPSGVTNQCMAIIQITYSDGSVSTIKSLIAVRNVG